MLNSQAVDALPAVLSNDDLGWHVELPAGRLIRRWKYVQGQNSEEQKRNGMNLRPRFPEILKYKYKSNH